MRPLILTASARHGPGIIPSCPRDSRPETLQARTHGGPAHRCRGQRGPPEEGSKSTPTNGDPWIAAAPAERSPARTSRSLPAWAAAWACHSWWRPLLRDAMSHVGRGRPGLVGAAPRTRAGIAGHRVRAGSPIAVRRRSQRGASRRRNRVALRSLPPAVVIRMASAALRGGELAC
jgi:hypothetical protein